MSEVSDHLFPFYYMSPIDACRRLVLLPLQQRIISVLRANGILHISSSVGNPARSYPN